MANSPKKIIEYTDREIQESILKSARNTEKYTETIKIWVQLWSILTLISFAIWLFINLANS